MTGHPPGGGSPGGVNTAPVTTVGEPVMPDIDRYTIVCAVAPAGSSLKSNGVWSDELTTVPRAPKSPVAMVGICRE
jgi:hypothetical protein